MDKNTSSKQEQSPCFNPVSALLNNQLIQPETTQGQSDLRLFMSVYFEEINKEGHTQLTKAAYEGNFELVKKLVQFGVNLNAQGKEGKTALIWAIIKGHQEIVSILLENKADIEWRDKNENTALHYAIELKKEAILSLITRYHANLEMKNINSITPLLRAVNQKNLTIAKILIEAGALVDNPKLETKAPLLVAIEQGDLPMVQLLVAKAANKEVADNQGRTPILIASEKGYLDIVQFLLNSGANRFAKDRNEYSALHLAVINSHDNLAKVLIEAGLNIEAATNKGDTALLLAIRNDDKKMTELLIKSLANKEAKNNEKETPLLIAAKKNYLHLLKYLIDCGVSPDTKLHNGNTIIFSHDLPNAAREVLIEKGACLEAKYSNGDTVLLHFIRNYTTIPNKWGGLNCTSSLDFLAFVIKNGADLTARDTEGNTPLLLLASSLKMYNKEIHCKLEDILKLLLEKGADFSALNKYKQGVIELSQKNSLAVHHGWYNSGDFSLRKDVGKYFKQFQRQQKNESFFSNFRLFTKKESKKLSSANMEKQNSVLEKQIEKENKNPASITPEREDNYMKSSLYPALPSKQLIDFEENEPQPPSTPYPSTIKETNDPHGHGVPLISPQFFNTKGVVNPLIDQIELLKESSNPVDESTPFF